MKTDLAATALIATARKYLGYQAEMLGRTSFGERTGYNSVPWSGAFIDVIARESGLDLPSFVYTPAALAEFIRRGAISSKPRPGDIAIFNFASNTGYAASAFSQPHAGIVTSTRMFKVDGSFATIEGNINGPGAYQNKDGVHQWIRFTTDVIIFLRPADFELTGMHQKVIQLLTKAWKFITGSGPDKLDLASLNEATAEQLSINYRALRSGTKNKQIEVVQLALSQVTDINGCERGKWDAVTVAAFARFQRNIGRTGVEASGLPDLSTLKRLSTDTGLFQVPDAAAN
jgi:hypothetical protein